MVNLDTEDTLILSTKKTTKKSFLFQGQYNRTKISFILLHRA